MLFYLLPLASQFSEIFLLGSSGGSSSYCGHEVKDRGLHKALKPRGQMRQYHEMLFCALLTWYLCWGDKTMLGYQSPARSQVSKEGPSKYMQIPTLHPPHCFYSWSKQHPYLPGQLLSLLTGFFASILGIFESVINTVSQSNSLKTYFTTETDSVTYDATSKCGHMLPRKHLWDGSQQHYLEESKWATSNRIEQYVILYPHNDTAEEQSIYNISHTRMNLTNNSEQKKPDTRKNTPPYPLRRSLKGDQTSLWCWRSRKKLPLGERL